MTSFAWMGVDDPAVFETAAGLLRAGRAVVLPTDTVYGLAALPSQPGATGSLFAIKGRPADVPLAVLVDTLDQALSLVEAPSAAVERLVGRLWPGPLTVVLARRPDVQVELGGDGATVGVRCPDHDLVRSLARLLGPLAVTSANRHGQPTPATAADVAAALRDGLGDGTGDGVALVVDGGPCPFSASTVIDGTTDELRVLRPGPISPEAIARAALP